MKLSPAQRSLLLAMHGGAKVFTHCVYLSDGSIDGGAFWLRDDDRGDIGVSPSARVLVNRKLAAVSDSRYANRPVTLTPAGRELAEKIKEQA